MQNAETVLGVLRDRGRRSLAATTEKSLESHVR